MVLLSSDSLDAERLGTQQLNTLVVDIGGSGIKVMVLDEAGQPLTKRDRLDTPGSATPKTVIPMITKLAAGKEFDRVSVGFPGVVRQGRTMTAVNLHPDWHNYDLQQSLEDRLSAPVRVANDADIQGFGAIQSTGVELVVTLGTGFGSALFMDGTLVPNLELGHHPFRKGDTYEEQLGRAALESEGKSKWNRRLEKAIAKLDRAFNYEFLYLGGGNAKEITFDLPENVQTVRNVAGLLGGIALWK